MGTIISNKYSKKAPKTSCVLRSGKDKSSDSDKEKFVLTSVSKEKLEDRRIPVYPYLL